MSTVILTANWNTVGFTVKLIIQRSVIGISKEKILSHKILKRVYNSAKRSRPES